MIFPLLTLLFILTIGFIPGYVVARLLVGKQFYDEDWFELVFSSLTIGLSIVGTMAVLLAEIGFFSIWLFLVSWIVLTAGLCMLAWQQEINLLKIDASSQETKMKPVEILFLLVWLPAMLWLMLRPHQFVIGAADAGVYVNLGANIAKNGSIVLQDSTLAGLDPAVQDAFLRPVDNPIANAYLYPAFYVTDAKLGEIMPQFYPLHPVWQAVVYDFGGVQAELLLPGLWGVLGALVVYLTTRQIADWRIAALALVGLSLNALQVWFSRYPTSETLTQYLFWAGIWGTVVWLGNRKPARLWAFMVGVALGMTFLTRIDMLFLLPLLLFIIVWQWRRKQAAWGWFALPVLLLCLYSVVHAMWQSQPYFYELYEYAIRSLLKGPAGLFLATGAGLVGLGLFAYFYDVIMVLLLHYERPLRILLIIFILGLAIFSWFIRPEVFEARFVPDKFSTASLPVLDAENFIRLGWYLSPLGIWLGVAGICLLIWYADWEKSVLIMMGVFFALFYLWRIRNNPAQVYTMRRYVPVVLPLFVLGAAYFVGWVAAHKQTWAKAAAVLIVALWLGSIVWSARGFISQIDYVGMPEQIAALSQQLEPEAILIFNDPVVIGQGDIIGTPMKFLHDIEVFTLRDPDVLTTAVFDETLAQWHAEGRTVYWADVAGGHLWPSSAWELADVGPYHIETTVLETRYDRKPTELVTSSWSGTIMKVQPVQGE